MKKMPSEMIEVRREICQLCPTPCDKKNNDYYHRDPCSSCPIVPRRWGEFGNCKNFGLGDAVAALASPVAAASDKMFGTSLSSCGGCAKRREALNQMVPNILPPLSP